MKISFDHGVKGFPPDSRNYETTPENTSSLPPAEKLETEFPVVARSMTPGNPSRFVFFIPVIFLFAGLVAYFIVIPKIFGRRGSFFDWLFADPQNIIDTLQNPYATLSKAHIITEIRVFWYIWLAGFTVSLFYVGRQLNSKLAPTATNAILVKRNPYFLVCEIYHSLKTVQRHAGCDEFTSLLYAVKCLKERLSIESDFGCGNGEVIICENRIANQFQVLIELVDHIEQDGMADTVEKMQLAVKNINTLLKCRTELKKK